jgi:hypothetical protein
MAIVDDMEIAGVAPPPLSAGRLQWYINVAGAVTSAALVIGVGAWGYKLAVRDVAGIPVIRALDGPMRIAPQEPGGEIAANTGLSVNAIAAEGAASDLPEQMVLAPRPIDLTEEDQPTTGLSAPEAAAPAPVQTAGLGAGSPADPGLPALAPGELTETPVEAPVAVAPLAGAAPDAAGSVAASSPDTLEMSVDEALAEALGTDVAALDAADEAPARGLARSPRPERRPEGDGSPEAVEPLSADRASNPAEVDAASLTPGTRLVQLGAFDDEAGARSEWASLQTRFGDLIASKTLVLQKAQSGGSSFVRLRALGFDDEADARRFCSAILAEYAICIPVTYRP